MTDLKKENEGTPVKLIELQNEDETYPTFFLCSLGKQNKKYVKELTRALEKFKNYKGEIVGLTKEINEELSFELFLKTILIKWENLFDHEDKLIEFSQEQAKSLMIKMPHLYDRLTEESARIENFTCSKLGAELKN
jgi:hypothetical protein